MKPFGNMLLTQQKTFFSSLASWPGIFYRIQRTLLLLLFGILTGDFTSLSTHMSPVRAGRYDLSPTENKKTFFMLVMPSIHVQLVGFLL